jgi:hypothetical protein
VTAAAQRLELWQRLDWRFLLPELDGGPIACAGRPDEQLTAALTLLGSRIHHVTEPREWESLEGTLSLVVLVDPTPADLRHAAAACRPGGWVYAEIRRSARPGRGPRTLRGWQRAFAAAQLDSVTVHWHALRIATSSRIVPVAAVGAVRHALGQHQGVRSRRVLEVIGRLALRTGLFTVVIPEGSVIGRRPPERAGRP